MNTYKLTPLDTWFFRDGRPFNAGDMSLDDLTSQFPPPVTTLVGCLRAALAIEKEWDGQSDWPDEIKNVLGDRDDLKRLKFIGPSVLYKGVPIFPAPAQLLGVPSGYGWSSLTLMRPGPECQCDLGRQVRLPVAIKSEAGLKELANVWLTLEGMHKVLAGVVPDVCELVEVSTLWRFENRPGIARNPYTKVVADGNLYSCRHVRLIDKEDVSVAVSISGLPPSWSPASPYGIGGEGRSTWIEPLPKLIPLPVSTTDVSADGKVRFTVILNTPADLAAWPGPGGTLDGVPGTVVVACMGRPQRIGGWDSQKGPQPLRSLAPPGTVWFMKAGAGMIEDVRKLHGKHIGNRTDWGFGQVLIGNWKEGN